MSQQYEIQEPPFEIEESDVKLPRYEPEEFANKGDEGGGDGRKRKRALLIFGLVVLIGAAAGVFYWLHARQFEETDDAQVNGYLSPIGTRIDGTVTKVYVHDNQAVKVGDPLVDLDPRDAQVALDQALAQLAQARGLLSSERPDVPITKVQNATNIISARAEVASAEAAVATAQRDRDRTAAQVVQQQAANAKAQSDLKRYSQLVQKQEVSELTFDQYTSNAKQQAASLAAAKSALLAAKRTIDQRKAQLTQAQSKLQESRETALPLLLVRRAGVAQEMANVKAAEAKVEGARLNLQYTKIVAPVAGIVMKRSAQVGARVQAGQQILTIAEIGNLWVTANFKETQLLHMQPGQQATIHVDALDRDFNGTLEAIGGSTGSVASVLPPENATGNYVKVVQRIPIRIEIDRGQKGLNRLRPGMSVEPEVRVSAPQGRSHRHLNTSQATASPKPASALYSSFLK
ncbi:MAG: HlyD family secretion protein [Bryobacteraceae bacterium]